MRNELEIAVSALRALNSAVWLAFPSWAVSVPETAKASEVIANYEGALSEPGENCVFGPRCNCRPDLPTYHETAAASEDRE